MIILRQYEFGNKANKAAKREWELNQAGDMDVITPGLNSKLLALGRFRRHQSRIPKRLTDPKYSRGDIAVNINQALKETKDSLGRAFYERNLKEMY